jgi:GT2 family glycosyltransferase
VLISIVIVNYNTGNVLKECIDSLFKYESSSEFEIIIVDNHSADGPHLYIESLQQKYNNIRSIFLKTTVSFSSANNNGIKQAHGEYILIMNPDIIFIEPVFRKLILILEKAENIGVVCPALLGKNGIFQNNYFQRYPGLIQYLLFYSFVGKLFLRNKQLTNKFLRNEIIDIKTKKLYEVGQIPCAFFLTEKKILDDAGLLDENFTLFFEDVDLSYRIHKHYKLVVDTSSRVIHIGGASFGREYDTLMYGRFLISMNYFFKKHYSVLKLLLLKIFSKINSYSVISIEYIKKIFHSSNDIRLEKHRTYLKLLKEYDSEI